jgi:hypothetical protein
LQADRDDVPSSYGQKQNCHAKLRSHPPRLTVEYTAFRIRERTSLDVYLIEQAAADHPAKKGGKADQRRRKP